MEQAVRVELPRAKTSAKHMAGTASGYRAAAKELRAELAAAGLPGQDASGFNGMAGQFEDHLLEAAEHGAGSAESAGDGLAGSVGTMRDADVAVGVAGVPGLPGLPEAAV